eukprot:scaffold46988_cov91-Cyclotella_meneghiniana.AAC.2
MFFLHDVADADADVSNSGSANARVAPPGVLDSDHSELEDEVHQEPSSPRPNGVQPPAVQIALPTPLLLAFHRL